MRLRFVFGFFMAGLCTALCLAVYGPFQDSAVYYGQFSIINEKGFRILIDSLFLNSGKFEPALPSIFYIMSSLGVENDFTFLVINILLAYAVFYFVFFDLIAKYTSSNLFFCAVVIGLSYGIISKELYFWRSVWAALFLIYGISSNNWRRWLAFLVAALFHSQTFVLVPLYLYIVFFIKKPTLLNCFLVAASLAVLVRLQFIIALFSGAAAGGDASVYLAEGEGGINAYISVVIYFLALLCFWRQHFNLPEKWKKVYLFVFVCNFFALFVPDYFHLMLRIFMPASIASAFIVFYGNRSTYPILIARALIVVSVLPSIRLLFLLGSMQFTPA